MAYSKQTWTDDVSAVTGARMTHIEQGIYDNSLATDKINPSGTAKTTSEIEEGQINDVIGFKSLKLKGQTSQYTTQGNNLLNDEATKGIKIETGFSRPNMPITLTEGTYIYKILFTDGTYVNQNWNLVIALYDTNGTQVKSMLGNSAFEITSSEASSITQARVISNDTGISTYNGRVIKGIMFNSGSTAQEYEFYTGGKASPNPDFPQDVKNVSGYNVIEISNKNLIEDETFVQGSFNGPGTKRVSCRNVKLKANTTYTLSSNLNYSTYNVAIVTSTNQFPIGISETPKYDSGWKTSNFSFTTGNDDVYANIAVKKVGELVIEPSDVSTYHFQIEQNNSATSYIAHQGNNFDIDLPVENKLPYPYVQTTRTAEGITYTDLGDGRIKINGTATANSAFKLLGEASSQVAIPGNYVYGGVNSNVRVRAMNRTSGGTYTTLGSSTGSSTIINKDTYETGYVEISIASGTTVNNLIITPMLSDNEVNAYTPYGTNPIEICKIGRHQDYIYKKDGKWWKHKAIEKIILNGTESWVLDGALTNTNRFRTDITSYNTQNIALASNGFSNQLQIINTYNDDSEHLYSYKPSSIMHLYVFYNKTRCADLAGLQTYLSANNLIIHGILNTPIEEEITYAPLLRQLDELYNSGLYDVTNISQDNSSEAFILDMEACKNNINGIVEYIRR